MALLCGLFLDMGVPSLLVLLGFLYSRLSLIVESLFVRVRLALGQSIVMVVATLVLLEKEVELVLLESRIMLVHHVK